MGRKNYLIEKLSKEEKSYLKLVILNTRRKYIRDNYYEIVNDNIRMYKKWNLYMYKNVHI